ncbi:hypothetical protein ACHAWF_008139 [Thalassiosira exigua]
MASAPTESREKSDKACANPIHATMNPDAEAGDVSKGGENKTDDADGKSGSKPKGNSAAAASTKSGSGETIANPKPQKIKVHLVAVGNAPILKKAKFLMNADDRFAVAATFLRKVLKLSPGTGAAASALFLYVNAAFVPSPDERIGDLFDCFGVRGELMIHYSLQEAWG